MSTYKSLNPNDISRVPFNANKQFSLISSSASTASIVIEKFEWSASILNTFSSGTVDTKNIKKYYQLDHLFYKNYRLDISNKLGDADYLSGNRTLYNKVNTISIPTRLFGNKIKPGTFYYSGSNGILVDDKKGNLLISGTELISHSIDEREKVLSIGPIKGFKQYDVNYDLYGKVNPNPLTYYNNENIYDDSYYNNTLTYKNILFSKEDYGSNISGSKINFISNESITSSIISPHNETYNFNPGEDFAISFFINPVSASAYILCKSTTKTTLKTPIYQQLYTTGSSQNKDLKSKNQYPFEIFIDSNQKINFRRSDGTFTPAISSSINTGSLSHVVCMNSSSTEGGITKLVMAINGAVVATTEDTTIYQTENKANLYIGSKGEISNFYTGSMSNLMIFNKARSMEQIKSLSSSINGSPYVGNIFYSNGISTITHLKHQNIALAPVSDGYTLKFKNIHPIYENEYMCTIKADEFNHTHNVSTRKIKNDQSAILSDFATGSLFKPYVTTIGLYNEQNELLVIGKLGQPVKMSEETDTTFVLRWDT